MRCAGRLLQRVFGLLVILWVNVVAEDEEMYYNEFTVCADASIAITNIQLLCDSPGTYYYGSQKYRNSADCQGGDKARLYVEFQIVEDLEEEAYMTMYAQGGGSVSSYSLYTDELICDISDISNDYGYTVCADGYARAGYYKLEQQFYWGDDDDQHDDDGYVGFTPMVVIGFASDEYEEEGYDLGGANTNSCEDGTNTQYTQGVAKTAVNTIGTFLKTFGILVGCVALIVGSGWLVLKMGNARIEVGKRSGIQDDLLQDNSDDGDDDRKVAMVGQNRDLVNF